MRKDETAAGGATGYVDQERFDTRQNPDKDYVHPNASVIGTWTQGVIDDRTAPPATDSTLKQAPSR